MTSKTIDLGPTKAAVHRYPKEPQFLVSLLQEVQAAYRYLPRAALELIAQELHLPISKIYAVATFYRSFSLVPRGQQEFRVCTGTTCHIHGAPQILRELERQLDIKPGQTTSDNQATLEVVNCVGACALAPVVLVDDKAYGHLNVSGVRRLLHMSGINKTSPEQSEEKSEA